jgi:hypothetical protein
VGPDLKGWIVGHQLTLKWRGIPFWVGVDSSQAGLMLRLRSSKTVLGAFVKRFESEIIVESMPRTMDDRKYGRLLVKQQREELGWPDLNKGCKWSDQEIERLVAVAASAPSVETAGATATQV